MQLASSAAEFVNLNEDDVESENLKSSSGLAFLAIRNYVGLVIIVVYLLCLSSSGNRRLAATCKQLTAFTVEISIAHRAKLNRTHIFVCHMH